MLTRNVTYDGFEYVVERKEQQKICFGSTIPRTLNVSRKDVVPASCTYDIKSGIHQFLNKIRSRKGCGSLVNGSPRFPRKVLQQIPSPTRYDLYMKWPTKEDGAVPFMSRTYRKPLMVSKTPGPGTYKTDPRVCGRTRFDNNFGVPSMIQNVEEVCICQPVDTCNKCLFLCGGDYWQQNYTAFLCQQCMTEEKILHEVYSAKELKSFKKMRNCGYIHQHEGTTAAIRLQPARDVIKKHRLENYLDLFIKC